MTLGPLSPVRRLQQGAATRRELATSHREKYYRTTAAVRFRRALEASKAGASTGDHTQDRLLPEAALVLSNNGYDRRVRPRRRRRMHNLEHKTGFAVRATVGAAPVPLSGPEREASSESRADDVSQKYGPGRVRDTQ